MKISDTYNFGIKHPNLVREWDYERNPDTPFDVTPKSAEYRFWKCSAKGHKSCLLIGHRWEARVYSRSNGSGCPFCAGRKVCASNNLAVQNRQLVSEWHPTRNAPITPRDIVAGSHGKVWWLCKSCDHEWRAKIVNRAALNRGCPECYHRRSGKLRRKAAVGNHGSIVDTHPELINQWHPSLNDGKRPDDYSAGSHEEIIWVCLIYVVSCMCRAVISKYQS